MPSSDLIHRFLFENTDIRGEITTLDSSCRAVMENNRHLPASLQALLGEFLAAATLLSGTLKFDGILTLQASGAGPVSLIMAECSHHRSVRGIARLSSDEDDAGLAGTSMRQLLGQGVLALIIEPDRGERYQGLVPVEGDHLAACLARSEQLASRFWLAADGQRCAGLMLQALPRQRSTEEANRSQWETAVHLAATVCAEELLQLSHNEILYRLFHDEHVRVFEPAAVAFHCNCSRERSANALLALGREEVEALLAERDMISIDCQFCNRNYNFGSIDLAQLFGGDSTLSH